MFPALALGILISLVNVVFHCSSLLGLRTVLTHPRLRSLSYPHLLQLSFTMAITTASLMLAHFVEIAVWGLLFWKLHLADTFHTAYYNAFLSYTSLGFNIPPHQPWRLLEPISTMNGILLAGLSASIMLQVLLRTTEKAPK